MNARQKLTIGDGHVFGQLTAVGGTLNIQAGCVAIPGKLVVGGTAVFNDIEVKGCIINKDLEREKDCQVPPTEEIYNEWKALETIRTHFRLKRELIKDN